MRFRASTLLLALVFSMGMSLCHYANASRNGLTNVASAVINNERYLVAVGYGGVIYISTDAKNWRQIASGTQQDLYDVVWNRTNSQFVAVGANGMVLQSPTGLDWERVSLPSVYKSWHGALDLHSIAISDQEVCIVGENGLILCAKNDAGANLSSHTNVGLHFEKQESKTTATLLSITWLMLRSRAKLLKFCIGGSRCVDE